MAYAILLILVIGGFVGLTGAATAGSEPETEILLPPEQTCVGLICVHVVPTEKIGDLRTPDAGLDEDFLVTVETGAFRIEALDEFVQTPLVLANLNGTPDPAIFNQSIGPLTTNYTHSQDICFDGECTLKLGADADPEAEVIAEVWRTRIQVDVPGFPPFQGPGTAAMLFPPGEPPGHGPDELPPQVNCGGDDDWVNWADQVFKDADCDGWSNLEELEQGCDPLDPTTHPGNPGACFLPPDDPDEVESWLVGHLPSWANCGGWDGWESWLGQTLDDATCNGWTNEEELHEGCNPLNPGSTPDLPGSCLEEPDQEDPMAWLEEAGSWTDEQVRWLEDSLVESMPPWLIGIILWILDQP